MTEPPTEPPTEPQSEPQSEPQAGPRPERPGLFEQLRRTRDAARNLGTAHVELLKAELGAISGEIKTIAALVGAIIGTAIFVGLLLSIGGTLFIGEWLFGSIGWGLLHGLLLAIALIVVCALRIVDVPARVLVGALATAVVIGLVVGVVLAFDLARRAAQWGAEWAAANLGLSLDPGWAPLIVGVVVGAIVLGIVGLLMRLRGGSASRALWGFVIGAVSGALLGAFLGGISFDGRGGAAIGVTLALIAWPAISGLRAMRAGIDAEARFGRLWPRRTYETAMETKTWLEQEWTRRRQALSKR
jgi:hypothetical protein